MESQSTMSLLFALGPTALKTVGGLGLLLLGGRLVLRRIFEMVAEARSDETFVALCLLTARSWKSTLLLLQCRPGGPAKRNFICC